MPYYLEQTHGYLADTADRIAAAVKANDFDLAMELYKETTGKEPPDKNRVCWWKYNAPHNVRTMTGLTVDDFSKAHEYAQRTRQIADTKWAYLQRLVTSRVGGNWRICWEY